MRSKTILLFPKHQAMFEQIGQQFKLARKRRQLTSQQVAERAGINRTTLYQIEKGNAKVSMAAFFNVLRVFNLEQDMLKLAADDVLGRKLQDIALLHPDNL